MISFLLVAIMLVEVNYEVISLLWVIFAYWQSVGGSISKRSINASLLVASLVAVVLVEARLGPRFRDSLCVGVVDLG